MCDKITKRIKYKYGREERYRFLLTKKRKFCQYHYLNHCYICNAVFYIYYIPTQPMCGILEQPCPSVRIPSHLYRLPVDELISNLVRGLIHRKKKASLPLVVWHIVMQCQRYPFTNSQFIVLTSVTMKMHASVPLVIKAKKSVTKIFICIRTIFDI